MEVDPRESTQLLQLRSCLPNKRPATLLFLTTGSLADKHEVRGWIAKAGDVGTECTSYSRQGHFGHPTKNTQTKKATPSTRTT